MEHPFPIAFAVTAMIAVTLLAAWRSVGQVARRTIAVAIGVIMLAIRPALAQPPTDAETAAAAFPSTVAVASEIAPLLDGVVLGDPAWADAVPATGFRQTQPDEGEPASERTEVRFIFTETTLYVGVVCYDREAGAITVSDSRRDSSLDDGDSIQIILDTFRDKQSGFVFGTSPAGQESDGQVVNAGEGRLGRSTTTSSGSGAGFNRNWDGVWEVRTTVSDIGWSAEFAIPFRTISYPSRDIQTWGLNVQRTIRRRNEIAYWAPLPRQYNLLRLSLAGQLAGIRVPATARHSLKISPYVAGDLGHSDNRETTTTVGDVGVDVKYAVTPGLTLDLTYNTDFAQVEVDRQQINLDRFSLFFPEKRPFFLENAGVFSVSSVRQVAGGNPAQTELFFSRRIGIGPDGQEIPILAGARISGKVSDSVSIGVLNMQTDAVGGVAPGNNFTVARVYRDLPNSSQIGALFVNRQATGELAGADDYNRTYAVDGRWGIGQNGQIAGFVARTRTPGLEGDDHAYNAAWDYNSQTWRFTLGYVEVADHFNPEVGFLRRRGFRNIDSGFSYITRPKNFLKLQQVRPHATFNRFWNFDGFQESSFLHLDNDLEFNDSSLVKTAWNITGEGVTTAFEIAEGVVVPVGSYDHNETQLSYESNRGAPVSVGVRARVGGFFGGHRATVGPTISVRTGDTFSASLQWSRNDVDLPGGHFIANLTSVQLAYNFSPRRFVQALIQYNDSADLWSANLRLGLLGQANTGLFIVYNDTRGLHDTIPAGSGRSLILKFSRLFDLAP
ncbi:MAG: carbohydrate binding family 9 domain-containing protein [Acidobacteria bacterium]|nr:carbohydrate binding family 9 domain-containing protein [Acidobacteriota bacterium]